MSGYQRINVKSTTGSQGYIDALNRNFLRGNMWFTCFQPASREDAIKLMSWLIRWIEDQEAPSS